MSRILFNIMGIGTAVAMVFLAGCRSGGDMSQATRDGPKAAFVGAQKDYWCVVTPDRIRVTSELTLLTRPAKTAPMPIRLPYRKAQLEMATCNGRELGFQKTGDGLYDIVLPSDRLFDRQRQVTCQWLLPMSELRYESELYWTSPKSLIPVVSYELRAGVEPPSGFEVFGGKREKQPVAYSHNGEQPRSEFGGSCALPIRRRE